MKPICAQGAVWRVSEDGKTRMLVRLQGKDIPQNSSMIAFAASILGFWSREYPSHVKNSIFTHGLWNRQVFLDAIQSHGEWRGEREILTHLALVGPFIYIDIPLFTKTFYSKAGLKPKRKPPLTPREERRMVIRGILRAKSIPFWRKLIALPRLIYASIRRRELIYLEVRLRRLRKELHLG